MEVTRERREVVIGSVSEVIKCILPYPLIRRPLEHV